MDSVYGLLNTLCESICVREVVVHDKTAVKRCRKIAFEILFEAGNSTQYSHNSNVVEDLQICVFEQRLRADTVSKKNHVDALERCVESFVSKSGTITDGVGSALELLLHLRDTGHLISNGIKVKTFSQLSYEVSRCKSSKIIHITDTTDHHQLWRSTTQYGLPTHSIKPIQYGRSISAELALLAKQYWQRLIQFQKPIPAIAQNQ